MTGLQEARGGWLVSMPLHARSPPMLHSPLVTRYTRVRGAGEGVKCLESQSSREPGAAEMVAGREEGHTLSLMLRCILVEVPEAAGNSLEAEFVGVCSKGYWDAAARWRVADDCSCLRIASERTLLGFYRPC